MFDGFAVVGVGHFEVAVGCLDEGGIGVFTGLVLKSAEHGEVFSVGGDGEVEGGASAGGVVVKEDDTAIAEGDGVYAGVGVGYFEGAGLGPGDAEVVGIRDGDARGKSGGAGVEAEVLAAEGDYGGLNDSGGVLPVR